MWTFKATSKISDLQLEIATAQSLCILVNSPRSLAVSLLIKHEEWEQLMDLTIDARHYECSQLFADDYLVTKLLSKSPNIPLGVDKAEIAFKSFQDSESQCKRINDMFYSHSDSKLPIWFFEYQRELSNILGPLSKGALCSISRKCVMVPGLALACAAEEVFHLTNMTEVYT